MATREGFDLLGLTDDDIIALDLALGHYRDAVRHAETILPTQGVGESVVNLQRLVIDMKRNSTG